MKIDKMAFTVQSFEEAADHQRYYKNLKEEDKKKIYFLYCCRQPTDLLAVTGQKWIKTISKKDA